MDRKRFRELVEEAYERIPKEFTSRLENVVISVEDYPTPQDLDQLGIGPGGLLLGLYRGTPLPSRSVWQVVRFPDEIVLFQKPIESVCRTDEQIEERVNEVLVHEIAHYFGLSDDEIYELIGRH